MKRIIVILLLIVLLPLTVTADQIFEWKELHELPPLTGKKNQPGLAGAFAGVHRDALIIAGGANFSDGLPWSKMPDGSSPKKIYNRDIYILQKNREWIISDIKLSSGYSYGASITTDEGLICIGGEWCEYNLNGVNKYLSDKVFLIKHLGDGKLIIDDISYPSLPEPVSAMAAARIGDHIYITGGCNDSTETKNFWRLNISKKAEWEILEPWPGLPRSHLITVAQSDGKKNCLYIFSGRYNHPGMGWQFLTDTFKYDPDTGNWTRLADVGTNQSNQKSVCVMAATGIKLGANHIAVFGGAQGELFQKVEQDIPRQIRALQNAGRIAEAKELTKEKWALYTDHPGFSRDILVYHTITDTWAKMGEVPESKIGGLTAGSHVTTTAVQWDMHIIIPSGEVRPGVRSPKIWCATEFKKAEH